MCLQVTLPVQERTVRRGDIATNVSLFTLFFHTVYKTSDNLISRYLEFSSDSRFWDEIMHLIEAVRDETAKDEMSVFHRGEFVDAFLILGFFYF